MFEQSLLTAPPIGEKSRAIATSFVAQMSLLGVLLAGSLAYKEALPFVAPAPPIFMHFEPPAPPATRTTSSAASNVSATSSATPAPARPQPKAWVPAVVPNHPATNATQTEILIPGGGGPDVVGMPGSPNDNVLGTTGPYRPGLPAGPTSTGAASASTIASKAVTEPPPDMKPLRVHQGVQAAKLITKVEPIYPNPARVAHIAGTVSMTAVIGPDGHIQQLRTLSGPGLLRRAAEEAVRQWVYSPTYLSGQPVEVETSIDVNFILNQ